MTFALRVVTPITYTDAKIVSNNVPETDYPVWNSGTTYNTVGDRVIKTTGSHKVYQNLQTSNLNKDPATSPTWWQEVSATNAWKMFDTSNTTTTTNPLTISARIKPSAVVNTVGFLGMSGAQDLRVRMIDPIDGTVKDQTVNLRGVIPTATHYDYCFATLNPITDYVFTDLPAYGTADVLFDLTAASGNVSLATVVMGYQALIGQGVHYGARLSIQDYSRNETNQYGDSVLVKRAFARKGNYEMWLQKTEVDAVYNLLSQLRATPLLWIATEEYKSTIIYGIYKDFEITISYHDVSVCSLQLQGLT